MSIKLWATTQRSQRRTKVIFEYFLYLSIIIVIIQFKIQSDAKMQNRSKTKCSSVKHDTIIVKPTTKSPDLNAIQYRYSMYHIDK